MGNFGDVRGVLQQQPSEESWEALIDELDTWYGREPIEIVLRYCQDHLSGWAEEVPTFAPRGWFKRDPEVIAASPITPFFVFAFTERTEHWIAWARGIVEQGKKLKVPGFLDLDALGPMRWRTGAALSEDDRMRLITFMREFKEAGMPDMERLRQFLHDEDCQRWSRVIRAAWEENGSKSSHRWSLFQVASFGNQSDIFYTKSELERMVTSSRHARAKQYMSIQAALGTQEGLSEIARFAVRGALRLGTRDYARDIIKGEAKARGRKLEAFIEQRMDIYDPLRWDEPEAWRDPAACSVETDQSERDYRVRTSTPGTFAEELEHVMLIQRAFPWWTLRPHLDVLALQPGIVWSVDGAEPVRFTEAGPVGLDGEVVELEDGQLVRIAHPAALKKQRTARWRKALAALELSPPFTQLDRAVYTKRAPFLAEGDLLHIHPEAIIYHAADWSDGLDSGDYISEFCFHLDGAMWFAIAGPNFQYGHEYGLYLHDEAPGLEQVAIRPVLDRYNERTSWKNDPVAFSETQLALERLVAVSQGLSEDELYLFNRG